MSEKKGNFKRTKQTWGKEREMLRKSHPFNFKHFSTYKWASNAGDFRQPEDDECVHLEPEFANLMRKGFGVICIHLGKV